MKQTHKLLAFVFASAALFSSCSTDNDDDTPEIPNGAYEDGYFVLNEGQFGNLGTSGISFIGENELNESDAYASVNPTAPELGDALQSMFFDDYNAYIIAGSSNQITVVDRYTLEYVTTISTNLTAPRYGAIANGNAYVTNSNGWDDGTDDFVTVINLSDYSTSTFSMKNAEQVIEEDGILYFANGYYGDGNAVTILNPNTNDTTVIDLGDGNSPNSLVEEDNVLYVLTNNYTDGASIFKISTSTKEITETIALDLSAPKQLNIEDDILYFTDATSVYQLGITSTTPTKILEYTSTSIYGAMYGFAVEDDTIYIADAGDNASAGTTYEYTLTGTQLISYTVGIAPNGFYFND